MESTSKEKNKIKSGGCRVGLAEGMKRRSGGRGGTFF